MPRTITQLIDDAAEAGRRIDQASGNGDTQARESWKGRLDELRQEAHYIERGQPYRFTKR